MVPTSIKTLRNLRGRQPLPFQKEWLRLYNAKSERKSRINFKLASCSADGYPNK